MGLIDNKNIYLGISEKEDGSMKDSLENRLSFFEKIELDDKIIISAGLIHGNKVVIIDNVYESQLIENCDALITSRDDVLLTITVADCLPIYFFDRNKKIIALAHAGWRGVCLKIVLEVINNFVNHYNSNLDDLEVFIGPHIRNCHFEIQEDILNQFDELDILRRDNKIFVDLSKSVGRQLIELGINEKNINISNECTYCLENKYFSYRRDRLQGLKTMLAYLGQK
jgi:hypothetical protein